MTLLCGAAEPPIPAALFGQNFERVPAMATGEALRLAKRHAGARLLLIVI